MASSANQENKKVVGYGASSCTFRPPLDCAEPNIKLRNNINKSGVISQITDLASADLKVNMVRKLRLSGLSEELLNQYFILTPLPLEINLEQKDLRRGESLPLLRQCTPNINSKTLKKLASQCPIYENFLQHQPTRMLYFNNGGNDLVKFKKGEELHYYINWLENFLNIFEGVKLLIDNNIIHLDIKRANIVSNPVISGKGFRLIDFDMARHIDEFNLINNYIWFDFLNEHTWQNFNERVALVIPLNCYLIYCLKIIEMKKRRDAGHVAYDERVVFMKYPNLKGLLLLDDYNFNEQLKKFFIRVLRNFIKNFLNNHYLTNKCLLGFYTEFFGGIDSFNQSKLKQFYEVIDNFDFNTSGEQLNKIYRHIDLYSIGLCLLEFCFQNDNGYKLEGRNYIQEIILQFIIHNKLLNQDLIPDDNFNIDIVIRNYNILLQLLQTDYENALVNYQLMMAAQPQPQAQPQLVAAAEEAQTPEIIYLQYVELASLKEKEILQEINNYTMLVQLAQESASKEPQYYLQYMNMVHTSAIKIATEQESYINYIRLAGEKAIEIGTISEQYYQSSGNEQFKQYIQLAQEAEVNLERAQQIYLQYIQLAHEAEAEIQRISHQYLHVAAANNSSYMNMTGGYKKFKKSKKFKKFKKSIKKTLKKHFIKTSHKSKKHK